MRFNHFLPYLTLLRFSLAILVSTTAPTAFSQNDETSSKETDPLVSLKKKRVDHLDSLRSNQWFPLKDEAEFAKIQFYPNNLSYRLICDFVATPDEPPIDMPTGTPRKTVKFAKRGIITFTHQSANHSLNVYKRIHPPGSKFEKSNYHFIPFKDLTNGSTTYSAGRYLVFKIESVKENQIEVDFNEAYNPWCAYAASMPCPIPPIENHLKIEIAAGEKAYKK